VIPLRDVPGITASACAAPIAIASSRPTLASSRRLRPAASARHISSPTTISIVPITKGLRHVVSACLLKSNPATPTGTVATAISDSGIIVGYSYVPSGVYHAFVYADGKMIDAGTLPGTDRSQLSAVNSAGVAVGDSSNEGDPTPVIYAGGRLADLAALVDTTAYILGSASGIDEEGNIVATARLSGWWRAVLLRPK